MEITPTAVYWATRGDNISGVFLTFSIVFGIITFICGIITLVTVDKNEEDFEKAVKSLKIFFSVTILSIVLFVLIPTSKDIALMYGLPAMLNNRLVQTDLPDAYRKIVDMCLKKLDEKEIPSK